MPWKELAVREQRLEFVIEAKLGDRSLSALCARYGVSRSTGHRWLGRYERWGLAGMEEGSRRPRGSPHQLAPAVEEAIVGARRERPDWGARKLRHVLREQGWDLWPTSIHRVLLRRGLVRAADRARPATQRFERQRPNELWQMDFKGPKGWNEPVGPLSVLDDHSRYLIALRRTGSTRAAGVRDALAAAFTVSGVPEQMLMDHGTPWWNAEGKRGWTELSVWLMKQDIELHFGGFRHPQTQGKVERWHRSLTAALLRRGAPPEAERQAWLDALRHEYNHLRPHEALGMKTPSELWQPALQRRYQPTPPPWRYPEESLIREVDRVGQLRHRGRRWFISRALAGEPVRLLAIGSRWLVYYRRTVVCELDPACGGSPAGEPPQAPTAQEV